MYLPYVKVTAREDRIGNLLVWRGDNTPLPRGDKYDSEVAYIQDSQSRESIFSYCFDLTAEDRESLQSGYTVVLNLHEDIVNYDLFC